MASSSFGESRGIPVVGIRNTYCECGTRARIMISESERTLTVCMQHVLNIPSATIMFGLLLEDLEVVNRVCSSICDVLQLSCTFCDVKAEAFVGLERVKSGVSANGDFKGSGKMKLRLDLRVLQWMLVFTPSRLPVDWLASRKIWWLSDLNQSTGSSQRPTQLFQRPPSRLLLPTSQLVAGINKSTNPLRLVFEMPWCRLSSNFQLVLFEECKAHVIEHAPKDWITSNLQVGNLTLFNSKAIDEHDGLNNNISLHIFRKRDGTD
ncbi:uncharacterized protein G2W53_039337 [Senna tora]|uniref:Uncharacterized protein n=1 Tax=Senna tora TaxID=362788 RepID=A0A834SPT5_9FABA|nr:uncharacterized protein G2W53_039337 [Senna tora]